MRYTVVLDAHCVIFYRNGRNKDPGRPCTRLGGESWVRQKLSDRRQRGCGEADSGVTEADSSATKRGLKYELTT